VRTDDAKAPTASPVAVKAPAKASTEEKAKEAKPVAAKVPAGLGWSKKEAKLEKGAELSKKKPNRMEKIRDKIVKTDSKILDKKSKPAPA